MAAKKSSSETSKNAGARGDEGAPYLDKLMNGTPVIFVPIPGSSMGEMLDPKRDAAEARKAVAAHAKRKKLDVRWIQNKEKALGISRKPGPGSEP